MIYMVSENLRVLNTVFGAVDRLFVLLTLFLLLEEPKIAVEIFNLTTVDSRHCR